MTNELLNYKGFKGSVSTDLSAKVMHGKILFIRDLVTYEADTIPELIESFEQAVDEYLEDCKEEGVEPCKPCSGTLQIRMHPEIHEKLQTTAYLAGESLNSWICDAIALKLNGSPIQEVHHHEHKHTYNYIPAQEDMGIWDNSDGKTAASHKLKLVK